MLSSKLKLALDILKAPFFLSHLREHFILSHNSVSNFTLVFLGSLDHIVEDGVRSLSHVNRGIKLKCCLIKAADCAFDTGQGMDGS